MKFRKYGDISKFPQFFDREKITVTKNGNTYNQYDAIQAANVDTEIYEVMKKYHCDGTTAQDIMLAKNKAMGIYEDVTKIQELAENPGDIMHIFEEAKTRFEQLPIEIKTKYGNNLETFLEETAKKEAKAKEEIKQEVTNNETK